MESFVSEGLQGFVGAAGAGVAASALGLPVGVYSYALLIEGRWGELLPVLEKNAALIGPEELSRYARTARELDRVSEADRIADLVPRPRAANDFG